MHNAGLYRAAQRATDARDNLLGIVAHDLRNPLNNIVIQASLLESSSSEFESNPERTGRRHKRAAQSIRKAAKRMNRLIQDLLDVTQIDAGSLSLERRPIPVSQLIDNVIDSQKLLMTSAGRELTLDLSNDLPVISADHDRLIQVFGNLLGNAIKFTPAGGRITLGAAPTHGAVRFWIQNTGSRIPAEHLPHVFDRFWQATKGTQRGAGLGLPIVKGIIEAHGGRVWVESTSERGTRVSFTVPTA